MNEKNKTALYLFSLFILISNSIVLYVSFLYAYFFNDYQFSVHINLLGEAYIELIFLTVSVILAIIFAIKLIIHFNKNPEKLPE